MNESDGEVINSSSGSGWSLFVGGSLIYVIGFFKVCAFLCRGDTSKCFHLVRDYFASSKN